MTAGRRVWPVRLAAAAEVDFQNIVRWTAEHFGDAQARAYAQTLSAALEALSAGPIASGAKARDDIAKGVFTLHVARNGRRGRHFVVFRIGRYEGREVIDVLRLLHDAIDLPRHVSSADETN
jgi:toxin ParE1/3/4